MVKLRSYQVSARRLRRLLETFWREITSVASFLPNSSLSARRCLRACKIVESPKMAYNDVIYCCVSSLLVLEISIPVIWSTAYFISSNFSELSNAFFNSVLWAIYSLRDSFRYLTSTESFIFSAYRWVNKLSCSFHFSWAASNATSFYLSAFLSLS